MKGDNKILTEIASLDAENRKIYDRMDIIQDLLQKREANRRIKHQLKNLEDELRNE